MDDKKVDDKIKEALMKSTEESVNLKDQVWNNIQAGIKENQKGGRMMNTRKRKKNNLIKVVASAAAVLLVVSFVGTESGQAAIKKIKDVLVPQKKIVEELEGQKEDTDVSLNESEVGYSIYFDEERYVMEKNDGVDRIVPKIKAEGNIPEVYMEIQQIEDKKIDVVFEELKNKLEGEFPTVIDEGKVEEPVKGLLIRARDGENWDSTVVKYYLVDNEQGGTFVIKEQYFLEAAEGHGARFYHILQEFRMEDVTK